MMVGQQRLELVCCWGGRLLVHNERKVDYVGGYAERCVLSSNISYAQLRSAVAELAG
jgi:hypothetical protein